MTRRAIFARPGHFQFLHTTRHGNSFATAQNLLGCFLDPGKAPI